jgi:hypothetical protein
MPDQVFKFPGYYDREIDLTARVVAPNGVPAGIVGSSVKGPAFIPYTLGSFSDFQTKFGGFNPNLVAPYAVEKFLQNRNALTFIRVLGAGSNTTSIDIAATQTAGIVKNAGFKLSASNGWGTVANSTRAVGAVQFLVARHDLQPGESAPSGFPMFTDNNSYVDASLGVNLVRGVIFAASGSRVMIMSASNEAFTPGLNDTAIYSTPANSEEPYFKIVISTSLGTSYATDDGFVGVKIYSASFNPTSDLYFGKLLNTDPSKFEEEQHYLYADFAVDDEVATVVQSNINGVLIASGTLNTSTTSGLPNEKFLAAYGRFDTRYTTPRTPAFISQPYGSTEHDLFHIEALDDGQYISDKIKISVQSLQASTNPIYPYGTFAITVRQFGDTDINQAVIEQFTDLTLDPDSDNYIGKIIGDAKAYFNFDVEDPDDRRIVRSGKYANKSNYIRVVISDAVEQKMVPSSVLPFGFRGVDVLNTNPKFTDVSSSIASERRLVGIGSQDTFGCEGAIVPPVPYRYKVTRNSGSLEITDARLFWGVKFERNNNNVENVNINNEQNRFIAAATKFAGISKLDVVVTGSSKDNFNNNKFTLARVAVSGVNDISGLTGTASTQMRKAQYIRNGVVDPTTYNVNGFVTFASLVHEGTQPITFNKYNNYAKFTTFLYGGFDGVNILDKHAVRFDDKSTSIEVDGGAYSAFVSPGFSANQNGIGIENNQINSYRIATDIITNPIASNINLLSLPGQREPFVTDYASDRASGFGLALYLMDIPNYNSSGDRIFDGEILGTSSFIDVQQTANNFDIRSIDNTFVSAYFPDVIIADPQTNKRITVPATVAALAAIGYNDKVAYPWFAPAGFNRAALNFVTLTRTRVNQGEREKLYQVRVNPIVKFPNEGYVIFAQKTLDGAGTSLDSINVQRMIMDVQRQVIDIGNKLIWQQLTPALYNEFVSRVTPILSLVQNRGGLRQFKVVCDNTNNTMLDRENNKMNAKIYLLPVKAVEFIALDFIVTREGVQFG